MGRSDGNEELTLTRRNKRTCTPARNAQQSPTSDWGAEGARRASTSTPAPMSDQNQSDIVTAALVVIGEEILSGRTQDANIAYIAAHLGKIGIALREVRIVPDLEHEIVSAVNALRPVLPMSSPPAASAPPMTTSPPMPSPRPSGSSVDIDPRAVEAMRKGYSDADLTPTRLRMARIPEGADLIDNPISKAPGFMLGKCHRHGRHPANHAGDA